MCIRDSHTVKDLSWSISTEGEMTNVTVLVYILPWIPLHPFHVKIHRGCEKFIVLFQHPFDVHNVQRMLE